MLAFVALHFYRLLLLEVAVLALASSWLGHELAVQGGNPYEPAIAVVTTLAAIIGQAILHATYFTRIRRLTSYDETMQCIESLIAGAQHSVWLFRAHIGDGSKEVAFFEILFRRMPHLNEVRRVATNHKSDSMEKHIKSLLDAAANYDHFLFKLHCDPTPYFSYMIVDEKAAVLGLPTTDRKAIHSSLLVEEASIVNGLKNAFELMWSDSTELKGRGKLDAASLAAAKTLALSLLR